MEAGAAVDRDNSEWTKNALARSRPQRLARAAAPSAAVTATITETGPWMKAACAVSSG